MNQLFMHNILCLISNRGGGGGGKNVIRGNFAMTAQTKWLYKCQQCMIMGQQTFKLGLIPTSLEMNPCYILFAFYRIVSHLGSGQFGSVEHGVWKRHGANPLDVALKSLNNESSEEDKVKFLQEAAIMGQFRHPNVISLHGVMTRGKPVSFNYQLQ